MAAMGKRSILFSIQIHRKLGETELSELHLPHSSLLHPTTALALLPLAHGEQLIIRWQLGPTRLSFANSQIQNAAAEKKKESYSRVFQMLKTQQILRAVSKQQVGTCM